MTTKRKISLNAAAKSGKCDGYTESTKTVQVSLEHYDQIKEFDPYDNTSVEKPTTYAETLFNFIKQSLGIGILALPNAFYHSGYVLGPICLVAMFVMSIACKHMLLHVNYALCKKKKVTCLPYKETIIAACDEGPPFFQKLGPYLRFSTDLAIFIAAFGSCIIYFTFISSNLKKVCDEYYEPIDQRLYMVAILVPLILINYIRYYKYLAPISLVTNFIALGGYCIILYYVFKDMRPPSERSAIGTWSNIPLFFGTAFFVYEPAPVVIPMARDMKQPRLFSSTFGVLNIGSAIVLAFCLTIGFFGYLAYGDAALGSVTLNLPVQALPANIARLSQAVVIFLSHSIQNYLVFEIVWFQWLSKKFNNQRWKTLAEYCLRTTVVCVECLLAVAIPNLDIVISLCGALGSPLMGFITPVAIHTAYRWKTTEHKPILVMQLATILLVAIFGATAGVIASISSIVNTFE